MVEEEQNRIHKEIEIDNACSFKKERMYKDQQECRIEKLKPSSYPTKRSKAGW